MKCYIIRDKDTLKPWANQVFTSIRAAKGSYTHSLKRWYPGEQHNRYKTFDTADHNLEVVLIYEYVE